MHLEKPQAKEIACPMDGTLFVPKRSWQKFCSDRCRNAYHGSMSPEALRRDLDELRRQVAALTQRVTVLDDPTAR